MGPDAGAAIHTLNGLGNGANGDTLSYGALAARMHRYARWAITEGLGKGDVVALMRELLGTQTRFKIKRPFLRELQGK